MKKIILTLLATALIGASFGAKYKVIEQSSRQSPIWSEEDECEYIVVSTANKKSLERAMGELLESVKQQFITEIAQNINSQSLSVMRLKNSYNKSTFKQELITLLNNNASEIPYLNDISESKILEYYWEIRSDKNSKELSYLYTIKYPTSQEEITAIVDEFDRYDEQIAQRYLKLKESIHSINSIEEINQAIEECDDIIKRVFDSERLIAITNLKRRYDSLYDQISVNVTDQRAGETTFALKIDGEPINYSSLPSVKYDSESIKSLSIIPIGDEYKLKYDPSLCIEGQKYTIQVNFTIGESRVTHDIYFTHFKNQAEIDGSGEVAFTAEAIDESILRGVVVALSIETHNINDFVTIDSISLEVEDIEGTISVKKPFRVKVLDGLFVIKFRCGGDLSLINHNEDAIDLDLGTTSQSTETRGDKMVIGCISGSYGSHTDATSFTRKIELPYKCNWSSTK